MVWSWFVIVLSCPVSFVLFDLLGVVIVVLIFVIFVLRGLLALGVVNPFLI